jgi:hypothetical protein
MEATRAYGNPDKLGASPCSCLRNEGKSEGFNHDLEIPEAATIALSVLVASLAITEEVQHLHLALPRLRTTSNRRDAGGVPDAPAWQYGQAFRGP